MGKSHKSKSKHGRKSDTPAIEDERFSGAHFRPQFQHRTVKGQNHNKDGTGGSSKIVLDERFSSVLTDSRFQLEEKDKYGRKNKKKDKTKEYRNTELDAFYTVAGDEKEKKEDEQPEKDDDFSTTSSSSSSSDDDDNNKKEDDLAAEDPASRISYLTALSRGELEVSSSSSSDNDSDDSSDDDGDDSSVEGEDPVHGTAGILDPSSRDAATVQMTNEESPFLAVMDLDWSHVRAADIFAILSSFSPPGSVKRVQVFLSDFGKEKMKHEIEHGPPSLWKKKNKKRHNKDDNDDSDDDHDENSTEDKSDDENDNNSDKEETDDDSDDDSENQIAQTYAEFIKAAKEQPSAESDFDPEKLRAYEASKLKYYFAVAEFTNPQAADVAYKEVDGMEFEHSSAAVDLRSIPKDEVKNVISDRQLRDEATSLPGNYVPPDFVVSALQQSNVECTWEVGDIERERMLTKYTSAEQWANCAEDDLKAYLASDNSSDDDDGDDSDNDSDAPKAKSAKLRKMLGLDDDDDDSDGGSHSGKENGADSDESDEDDQGDHEFSKEIRYDPNSKEIRYDPNKVDLQEKIRAKLQGKDDTQQEELTPWEKYKEKRREKKRERRETARQKRSDVDAARKTKPKRRGEQNDNDGDADRNKPSKEELELLLAGDNDEEENKDFDMRGLQRIEKNKDKKLRGGRRRKEDKLASGVSGQNFEIDLKDSRFAKVLDGDDGRFGIDRTDPQFKETAAMREIMEEQKARRKKRRTKPNATDAPPKKQKTVPKDVVEGTNMKSSGSAALSSLVKSLKTKVASK